jgi:hypothetical protein
MNWYNAEKANMTWLNDVPIPPPTIDLVWKQHASMSFPPTMHPVLPAGWNWDNNFAMGWPLNYHPNATYGIRKCSENGGSGAQAMYDSNGRLITDGLSAGTSDRISPTVDRPGHMKVDVYPYDWARWLDTQNGGTKYRDLYREVRPPHTGNARPNKVN